MPSLGTVKFTGDMEDIHIVVSRCAPVTRRVTLTSEMVEDSVRGPGLARIYRRTRPLMAGARRPGKLNVDMWLVR